MIAENDLPEVNGLVARFYGRDKTGNRKPFSELFDIQRRLLVLGVKLNTPVETPDPHAPLGGSTQVVRVAA